MRAVEPYQVPHEHYLNLTTLIVRVSKIEEAFQELFTVTSGYRTWTIHKRIYNLLNDNRLIRGLPEIPIPLSSRHLTGEAVDISDPDMKLATFIKTNMHLLELNQLWCEDPKYTDAPNPWVHFQIKPPRSGKRFFIP